MTRPDYPFGFRVVGPLTGARRTVKAAAALAGHASCAPEASASDECYLSAFQFGAEYRDYVEQTNSPKGYVGPCWSPWMWVDVDRNDPEQAACDARKFVGFVLDRYAKLDDDELLVFFSGRKGYHVGVPLSHNPAPSGAFHRTARGLAEGLAAAAGVGIDGSIYDRVRAFRAPNSRHPKSGRYKRRVSVRELMNLSSNRIAQLASEPAPFDLPTACAVDKDMESDWAEIAARVGTSAAVLTGRPHPGRIQRATSEFLAVGAPEGERSLRLFRAAADLTEFTIVHGTDALVAALLTEPGLESGLTPAETARQIRTGIDHARGQQARAGSGGAA